MWMSWVQILAFRDQVNGPLSMLNKVVFALGSLVYGRSSPPNEAKTQLYDIGALLAAVAIEFPDGLYGKYKKPGKGFLRYQYLVVGLVYTLVIGSICILIITLNRRRLPKGGILTMGRRTVLQYYLGK